MEYFAHISDDGSRKHDLRDHLLSTAKIAREFGQKFGAGAEAYYAGLYHDIGKAHENFQARLRGSTLRYDHSTPSFQYIFDHHKSIFSDSNSALVVAMCIAGHHAGIPDFGNVSDSYQSTTLKGRSKRQNILDYTKVDALLSGINEIDKNFKIFQLKDEVSYWQLCFFIRMVFSCLVDADYLDTENFMRGDAGRGGAATLEELDQRLDHFLSDFERNAEVNDLNVQRQKILQRCQESSVLQPGLFTLTVPTGGGKTLSSLSFALKHAIRHGMDRIVYVIPYTSIIDQVVDVFRRALGKENVLAHHSSVNYDLDEFDANDRVIQGLKLAAENWDAPVVVTSSVQFFESFHSIKPSRCRKLHNVSKAVIILDEVQLLPINYLRLCLATIYELALRYGSSAVFCTATQPQFEKLSDNDGFLKGVLDGQKFKAIINDTEYHKSCFDRVTYEDLDLIPKELLLTHLENKHQVLCVVNMRSFGLDLYQSLLERSKDRTSIYFMSTWLTPYDRRILLKRIKKSLNSGQPCCLISTSLIEAGVDLDFPLAYREIIGLDSIIQTAGRCNREGKNKTQDSIVSIFEIEGSERHDLFRARISAFEEALKINNDIKSPEIIRAYYDRLYYLCSCSSNGFLLDQAAYDAKLLLKELVELNFRVVSKNFKLIEDDQLPVYIELLESNGMSINSHLLMKLKNGHISKSLFRELSQFSVNLYPYEINALKDKGVLDCVRWGDKEFFILWKQSQYDRLSGLNISSTTQPKLIV